MSYRIIKFLAGMMAILLVLGGVPAAEAQDKAYTIKIKEKPDVGMSIVTKDVDKQTGVIKVLDAQGQLLNENKVNKAKEEIYTEVILEKGDKHPKKYKQTYEKAIETEDGKTTARSYQGRTLLYELKDGKYQLGVVGKPPLDEKDVTQLLEKANEELEKNVDLDKLFLPGKPVKVGDTWTLDNKMLVEAFNDKKLTLDAAKSKGTGKLVKAYQKDGKQWGVLQIDLKLALQTIEGLKLDTPAEMDLQASLDVAIDGSSTAGVMTMTGKMTLKSQFEQAGMKFRIEGSVELSGKKEASAEKDDPKGREVPSIEKVEVGGGWKEFTSKDGGFSARFPDKPKETSKKGDKGDVTYTFAAEVDKGVIQYMVTYTDFAGGGANLETKVILDAIAKNFGKMTKAKKDIKLGDNMGLELTLEWDQDGTPLFAINRIFMVKGRLYQVMAISLQSKKDQMQTTKFMESFKLVEKKEEKPKN